VPTGGSGGSGGSGQQGSGGSAAGSGGTGGSAGAGGTGSGGSGGTSGSGGSGGSGNDAGATETAGSGPEGGSAPASDGGLPGLTSIFDGKSLAGWEGSASVWTVKDGILTGGGQRGQLTTVASYENFRLTIWMRLASGDDHLGICFWGTKRVFDCLLVVPPSGAIYDYVSNSTVRPIQYDPNAKRMWHQTELLVNRTTGIVKVAVNGEARPDYKDPRAAGRKAGPIGLQLHSGGIRVEFKEIFVEVNPKEDRLLTVK
jgi:hypothetical protein